MSTGIGTGTGTDKLPVITCLLAVIAQVLTVLALVLTVLAFVLAFLLMVLALGNRNDDIGTGTKHTDIRSEQWVNKLLQLVCSALNIEQTQALFSIETLPVHI